MKIVCISDTHGAHGFIRNMPDGDVLVVAGDFTYNGKVEEAKIFDEWLGNLPHPNKIVIAGNHDLCMDSLNPYVFRSPGVHYLEDSDINIGGIRFWGSPFTPRFANLAFEYDRPRIGQELTLGGRWGLACSHSPIDVLITHGPPAGVLDRESRHGTSVGCADLRDILTVVSPRLHVFGHIHEGYGCVERDDIVFVNASQMTKEMRLNNSPIVVYLKAGV